jgi:ABC-type multidrug transport system fused ATPase/permease subunit
VLRDIGFEVGPGEVLALVGRSGAGKSTIAQLIPRLYDPDEGAVCIDGADLREYTLESLRSQVSLVLQETVLLSGTIAENIGYGIEGATREQIEQAARSANAHDFILALPEGYDSEVGERGATLSGGQRQRIAIARAFIRRAPILVLDEPTTGLDADSTRLVVGALRTLMRGTTTIIISHDADLVRCADRVLVVEDGAVAEEGSPTQLARAGGRYADLMRRWSAEFDGGRGQAEEEPAHPATVEEIIHRLEADGVPAPAPGRPHRHALHANGHSPQPADGPEARGAMEGRPS